MAGRFEVYQDKSGRFRFRQRSAAGQVIARGKASGASTAAGSTAPSSTSSDRPQSS